MTTTIEAPVAAPPTNAQRAAYICHQGGVRAFVPLFTELLDRIQELEHVNLQQATRLANLELIEEQRVQVVESSGKRGGKTS
jgi:hypothetical protein